uniref:hypothetical protein RF1 n=1 Tax=Triphyophyllum peltatum TaxID=63090 RepID=UPI0022A6CBEE|nr:hypothetical protein RF1 [Triphyophyllum peltatum]UZT27864.1 hypothetical protein RF1 [Triphyophyllum peltatum]
MILKFFLFDNLVSLCMKILNSVVVVGLYYGFLTAFSISPSYLFFLQAQEESTEEKVAATTGFFMGQLIMLISIYYTPLHLTLGRPHTMTILTLPYLLLNYCRNNQEFFFTERPIFSISMRNLNTQYIFLNNLVFQLFNHFLLPSSMVFRLVNIYMFQCNKKFLFVTSSFVGWLIVQFFFIKWLELIVVWIRRFIRFTRSTRFSKSTALIRSTLIRSILIQYTLIRSILIRSPLIRSILIRSPLIQSTKSFESELGSLVSELWDFVSELWYFVSDIFHSMDRICSILLVVICIHHLGAMPLPLLYSNLKEISETNEKKGEEEIDAEIEEEIDVKMERTYETKRTKKEEEKKNLLCFGVNQNCLVTLLFDYNQWNRPLRYIRNDQLENAVKNETSQYFFSTCQNDGKERISFTYPPSLSTFLEMIQRKKPLSLCTIYTTEKFEELNNYWIYTNEEKKNILNNEFRKRIEALDTKYLYWDVLEKKNRLCNDKRQQEYLPKKYDPLLNGPYRGIKKKLFLPAMLNEIAVTNSIAIENSLINKIHSIIFNDSNCYKFEQKKNPFDNDFLFDAVITDSIIQTTREKSFAIKEINKKVPRWPYKLIDDYEQYERREFDNITVDYQIRLRKWKGVLGMSDTLIRADADQDKDKPKEFLVRGYVTNSDFRREIIKGSMRAQRRKTSIWNLIQIDLHSPLFLDRLGRPTYDIYTFGIRKKIKQLKLKLKFETPKVRPYRYRDREEQKRRDREEQKRRDRELRVEYVLRIQEDKKAEKNLQEIDPPMPEFWEQLPFAHGIRSIILIMHSCLRKQFTLPFLIRVKHGIRSLLGQESELAEDLEELKQEMHFLCNLNGAELPDNEFPPILDGIQIKVLYPFRLRPWYDPNVVYYENENQKDFCYLTLLGLEADRPSGLNLNPLFWKPILDPVFEELKKEIQKFRIKFQIEFLEKFGKKLRKEFFLALRIFKERRISFFKVFKERRISFLLKVLEKVLEETKKEKVLEETKEWSNGLFFKKIVINIINFYIKIYIKIIKKYLVLFNLNPILILVYKKLKEDLSEIKKEKEKDSRMNNLIIHESSIQTQSMDWKNLSLTEIKMKNRTDRTSTIKKEIERITKDKENIFRTRNSNPNKPSYGTKRIESICQKFKRRNERLIRKSHSFLKFFWEKIYINMFLYININININNINIKINIIKTPRRNTQPVLESKKKMKFISTIKKSLSLFISNINKIISKIISKINKIISKIISKINKIISKIISKINKIISKIISKITKISKKNSNLFFSFSFLSQAHVFYELSQTQVLNLYKLRSVLEYHGTSLFLKNEIKDSRTQGIIYSQLKHKKLHNSEIKQWKIWLKSNYQYNLSPIEWSKLVPQKWRNRVNQHCKVKNPNLSKRDSYKKKKRPIHSLQKKNDSEIHENKKFKKIYRYDLLSYKFLYYEDNKDLYSYESPFQLNKNQSKNSTYNYYNTQKEKKVAMWGPITNYLGKKDIIDIDKNPDRKFFDWIIFNYQNQIFDKMNDKDLFYFPIHQEINSSNQKKNLFDWMGMNEEIFNRPISNFEPFFSPEFWLYPYYTYKRKPWIIPIRSLFFNLNVSKTLSKNKNTNRKKKKDSFILPNERKSLSFELENRNKEEIIAQWDPDFKNQESTLSEEQRYIEEDSMRSERKKRKKRIRSTADLELEGFLEKFLVYQVTWDNSERVEKNIQILQKNHRFRNTKRMKMKPVSLKKMNLDELKLLGEFGTFNELIEIGVLIIDAVRLSKSNGQFLMYQTIGISLVHKSKDQKKSRSYENLDKKNFDESIAKHQKMTKNRDKNHYDLFSPETILLPRRRRELRILICFNSKKSNGVDKNEVFCNRNKVKIKNCGQFFDESKDLNKDKTKLIKLKLFLWPNFRLEDLACMNRYWFDTTNSSRFSMLRIHMYPRLKIY